MGREVLETLAKSSGGGRCLRRPLPVEEPLKEEDWEGARGRDFSMSNVMLWRSGIGSLPRSSVVVERTARKVSP